MLLVAVVDEVRGEIATIELHAFDDIKFVGQRLAVLNSNDAFLANLFHGIGDDFADVSIGIGGNGTYLGDFLGRRTRLGKRLQFGNGSDDRLVDAALQIHRVHAGGNILHAFADNRLGQHGGSSGAVTGDIGGLGSNFLDHLGAHVGELVFQFDFLGDRNAVLGDGRGAVGALNYDIAAFRAKGNLDRVSQDIDALDHAGAGGITEFDFFCSH